jgi:hypothetical protein
MLEQQHVSELSYVELIVRHLPRCENIYRTTGGFQIHSASNTNLHNKFKMPTKSKQQFFLSMLS